MDRKNVKKDPRKCAVFIISTSILPDTVCSRSSDPFYIYMFCVTSQFKKNGINHEFLLFFDLTSLTNSVSIYCVFKK